MGLAVLSVPASASTITYTISGTVIDGRDSAGLFGGGSLAGREFSAVETFSPAASASHYSNPKGSGANGGASANGSSFATVMLTIGGAHTSFSDYTSSLSSVAGSSFVSSVQSSGGANKNDIGFYVASDAIEADYTRGSAIKDLSLPYAGYYTLNDAAGQQVDFANFEVTGLTSLVAVPLPASAPLFAAALMALSAVGYGLKRKGKTAVA